MAIELDKPYLSKRVKDASGTLHLLAMDGDCDAVTIGKPYFAKRVKAVDDTLYFVFGDQILHTDGTARLNKPYLSQRVKADAGVLRFLFNGKVCEPFDIEF